MSNPKSFRPACIRKAVAAGMLITMGCAVRLAVGGLPGVVLFAAGLYFVMMMNAQLFTGIAAEADIRWGDKALILAGNILGAFFTASAIASFSPAVREAAVTLMGSFRYGLGTYTAAVFCGICMWLATRRVSGVPQPLSILFGVCVFILSGYTHSIAMAGYVGLAAPDGFAAFWSYALSNVPGLVGCALCNLAGSYLAFFLLGGISLPWKL
ncbi:MAG: hypothetical protein IJ573_03190 [Clostridia bacterium]|nr:hypothetical protein [Clostridia bacterium]